MVVDRLGTTFAALSDPTRRAMIERLSHGPASVHGFTEPFPLSQQMISKHIAYLVRTRIVIKTKRGRESVCALRPEAIKTVRDIGRVAQVFDFAGITNGVGAPSFAFFVKGGTRKCSRIWVNSVAT